MIANWLMLLRGGRLGQISPTQLYRQVKDTTAEQGYLGTYSQSGGLHVELPRCLVGNVLDRDSVSVSMRNALLRYFRTTSETFILPKGARNVVTCTQALQGTNFSFRTNGPIERAVVFQDRDVRRGPCHREYQR